MLAHFFNGFVRLQRKHFETEETFAERDCERRDSFLGEAPDSYSAFDSCVYFFLWLLFQNFSCSSNLGDTWSPALALHEVQPMVGQQPWEDEEKHEGSTSVDRRAMVQQCEPLRDFPVGAEPMQWWFQRDTWDDWLHDLSLSEWVSQKEHVFFYKVFLLGFFVVSDCQGSFQQTKGLQPRFGCYLASKTSEIHSRDDSNVAGPCGAGYPATTGIYEGRRVRGFGPSSGHKAKTVWLFVWCILKEHVYVFVGFTLLFRKCYWCSRNISWTLEEALLSAEYGVAVANLSRDYREAVSYNLRKNKARFFQRPHQTHSNKQALKLEFPERWNRTDMCSKRLGFISCSGYIFEPSNNPLTLNTIMLCV